MVAPAVTHRDQLADDLRRAIERAAEERIVVFHLAPRVLGVASVSGGVIAVKRYQLQVTGEGAGDLRCSCPAGQCGRVCKHLAAGIFARKHGVYAAAPQTCIAAAPVEAVNPLVEMFE